MSFSNVTGSLVKGGPATHEGKEVVKWNATRHGIRSPAPVVPGVEKAEDWELHLAGTLESLSPEGHLETVLAERVALLSWRLHRVIRYETESIALFQESVEDDLAKERRFESGPAHPEAVRGNAKSDEQDHKLLKRFVKMKDDKRLSSLDADIIIWGAMECADKVAEGKLTQRNCSRACQCPVFQTVTLGKATRAGPPGWYVRLWSRSLKLLAKSPKNYWRQPRGTPGSKRNGRSGKLRR